MRRRKRRNLRRLNESHTGRRAPRKKRQNRRRLECKRVCIDRAEIDIYLILCLWKSLSLFARGGGGSSSFSSPMFSTTSSSSFQQLASPRPLSPRPSLLYSSKVSFRCLKIISNTPSGDDSKPRFLDETFLLFCRRRLCLFSSSRRLLARRSTPSSSTRPKCSPLPCSASRKSRRLYLPARPSSRSLRGIVRPFRRDDGRPRRVGRAVQDVLFLSFFPLFPLFPLFATAGAQHVRRDSYSRSLPSRSVDLLVHVESRDVPVLLEVQKATKARRRPWYLLPFSLSLSLFRAK